MLDRFKDLHGLGYLHLDLSPDNIILGSSNFRKSESS
jgi:serine/threonine protein kinase